MEGKVHDWNLINMCLSQDCHSRELEACQGSFSLSTTWAFLEALEEAHWLKPPTLARHHSNYLHELFYDRKSCKEHGTNNPPPTWRVRETSGGDTTCPTTSQNPSRWHPSWLNRACTTRKDSESEWLGENNPETSPFTMKPETVSHVQSSSPGIPYPTALCPGALSQ